ncbi:MAG: carbohydrate ABC transporter permease [Anaerolineae bacterium]
MNTHIPVFNMSLGAFLARATLLALTIIWVVPTFGLLVSSFRESDQINETGWWTALTTSAASGQGRTGTADDQVQQDGTYIITGNIFAEGSSSRVRTFGAGIFPVTGEVEYAPEELEGIRDYSAGETVELEDGTRFTLESDGTYTWASDEPFTLERGQRIFFIEETSPTFTFENYDEVLNEESVGQTFLNTFTVTIPATIIPIAIAAFAAYGFSWMEFPGRQWLFALVIGLLVVPLQLSLIPLLRLYNDIGISRTYPGIWLAHTGFGLPLALYLLRNYIGNLPREIIESAKIDGATHFEIFMRLILPLSMPALAAFAIFQFMWVWNDLLVAIVFLGRRPDQIVLTAQIRELIGSRGENWEILTSSAFISMSVPLLVFFMLQRYFVRGLLAGSVKGG